CRRPLRPRGLIGELEAGAEQIDAVVSGRRGVERPALQRLDRDDELAVGHEAAFLRRRAEVERVTEVLVDGGLIPCRPGDAEVRREVGEVGRRWMAVALDGGAVRM